MPKLFLQEAVRIGEVGTPDSQMALVAYRVLGIPQDETVMICNAGLVRLRGKWRVARAGVYDKPDYDSPDATLAALQAEFQA